MLSLSTSDFQPLPLFLHPHLLPPPSGPTSTTSSWFGAGGRESREAGAGRRHRTAESRGQSLENVVWELTQWLDGLFYCG